MPTSRLYYSLFRSDYSGPVSRHRPVGRSISTDQQQSVKYTPQDTLNYYSLLRVKLCLERLLTCALLDECSERNLVIQSIPEEPPTGSFHCSMRLRAYLLDEHARFYMSMTITFDSSYRHTEMQRCSLG